MLVDLTTHVKFLIKKFSERSMGDCVKSEFEKSMSLCGGSTSVRWKTLEARGIIFITSLLYCEGAR